MKKGFTLVELLAVIIILSVIALITLPIVKNSIEESRNSANIKTAQSYIRATNQYLIENIDNGEDIYNVDLFNTLTMSGVKPTDGKIVVSKKDDGTVVIRSAFIMDKKCYYNHYQYGATDNDFNVTSTSSVDSCFSKATY